MKLTILGFSPPYPNPNKATTSFLLKTQKDLVLIDCGHGAVSKILEKEDPKNITSIIISHMHPDHFFDLIPLRNVYFKNKLPKVALLMPPEGITILNDLIGALRLPEDFMSNHFNISEYDPKIGVSLNSLDITMLKTIHPINTYALLFKEIKSGNRLIFTSDSAIFPGLIDFCKNADLLIIECADYPMPNAVQRWHLSPEEVAEIINIAQPKTLVISHYETRYEQEIQKILKTHSINKIDLAKEFKEYFI